MSERPGRARGAPDARGGLRVKPNRVNPDAAGPAGRMRAPDTPERRWYHRAACATDDADGRQETFFYTRGSITQLSPTWVGGEQIAVSVCARCPLDVAWRCLREALGDGHDMLRALGLTTSIRSMAVEGCWAGTWPADRKGHDPSEALDLLRAARTRAVAEGLAPDWTVIP